MRFFPLLALCGGFAGGCAAITHTADAMAFNHRSAHSLFYAQLAPETQSRLARGEVALGDTPEMVQLARGAPDRIERTERGERWIYEAYLNGGETVMPEFGPPNYRPGRPTLIQAIAFREGKVVGVVQRK